MLLINKKQSILACALLLFLGGCADNTPVVGAYPKTGTASWYSARRTATGERFDGVDLTCAMRKTGFGKYYKVCNADNGKCVVVRHNNFGPAKYLYAKGRIIDLSKAAFSNIADVEDGIVPVSVEEVR
jgi:rare lipoprotein A